MWFAPQIRNKIVAQIVQCKKLSSETMTQVIMIKNKAIKKSKVMKLQPLCGNHYFEGKVKWTLQFLNI